MKTLGVYLKDVSLAYGSRFIVEGLTGLFPKGQMTAILGPNGGGKTTLFRALMSFISPSQGSISFKGLPTDSIAYLAQKNEIDRHFPLTVFDVVAMGHLAHQGAHKPLSAELKEQVETALEAIGLQGLGQSSLDHLSGGQLQRTLFARLSLQKASLILLDEPFAAVDPYTLDELVDCLCRWQQDGATILMITHDLDVVRKYFPYALLLAQQAVAWDKTEKVLTPDHIKRAKTLSRQLQT